MRRLLESCTSNCHPWNLSSYLPTRLIDVGIDSASVPHLTLSSDIRITGEVKYAALSYCWGSEEDARTQFKTERASLERRCNGLPYELMTPAIIDAVALTRAIGLRYLWLDAICIVQDDITDWEQESSQMNLVYQHAFVTFCGLNSASCHETLLQRAPAVQVSFQSTVRLDVSGYYLVRLRPRSGDWLDRHKQVWDRSVSRWAERGWTYQEQELSSRLLLFGSLRMHFQCGKRKWSDGDKDLTTLHSSEVRLLDRVIEIKRGELPARDLYDRWLWTVHQYGSRSVTREKDRLPAISGLARIVWDALGDQYLAGLWKGDVFRGLDWISGEETAIRSLQSHLQHIQQRVYVAPSWSWAANTGSISTCFPIEESSVSESTLVDVNVETESQNPFGKVSGGFLQIRGNVAPIPASLPHERLGKWGNTWRHDIDGKEDDASVVAWLDWLQKGEDTGLENLVMILLLQHHIKTVKPHGLHHNQARPSTPVEGSQGPQLSALMLHPVKDSYQFYRVGVIHAYGWAGCDLLRTWFEGSRTETVCII